jgi:hypothetical protein
VFHFVAVAACRDLVFSIINFKNNKLKIGMKAALTGLSPTVDPDRGIFMFKHLLETFETMQIAVTFAEAGESETALQVMRQQAPAQPQSAVKPRLPLPATAEKQARA